MTVGAVSFALLLSSACAPQTASPSVTTTSEGQVTESPAGKSAALDNTALLRFVNASPVGRPLDIVSGDHVLFSGVSYKSITPYMKVPRGYTQFKLRENGSAEDLGATRRELFPGRHYTVVALPTRKGADKLVSLSDNLGDFDPSQSRVRLINATSDVDDVVLYKEGTNIRLAHGVAAGAITSFTDLMPGSVELHQSGRETPMKLSMLPVLAEHLYTFIIVGTADQLDAVTLDDHVER